MRGFRAVDRGRAKRRRTRGRMRRGSLTCVKTLREKYTLPNGSTSAPPETGSALRRASRPRKKTLESVAVNDAATAGEWGADPVSASAATGPQRRRTSQGNGREPRRVRDRARAAAEKACVGSRRNDAPQEKPAPGKPERTRNGRPRQTDVRPSPRVGGDVAGSGGNPIGRRRQ